MDINLIVGRAKAMLKDKSIVIDIVVGPFGSLGGKPLHERTITIHESIRNRSSNHKYRME